jgi:F0F1-type ATP synthase membrane subunit c/vacuolar-type H+-ATPase subunit K
MRNRDSVLFAAAFVVFAISSALAIYGLNFNLPLPH